MKNKGFPFYNLEVAEIFDRYPPKIKKKLNSLRNLILHTASRTPGAGELEETLRWGQPSYISTKSKTGSTIRIDRVKLSENEFAMYFHCRTNLIETFRKLYPDDFKFLGNRAIVFNEKDKIPIKKLSHYIQLALTYHVNKLK